MTTINVTKRAGESQPLDINKIHRVLERACEGLDDVSISDIEFNAQLLFYDGIPTSDIHYNLVKSASDLISLENPNYQYVAARLLLFKLRKDVWGESEPPRLYEHIKHRTKIGIYTPEILEKYTQTEIHKLGKHISHARDDNFTYSGLQQMVDKYLCKDRIDNKIYETPQHAYILIAMTLFMNYDKRSRLKMVKQAYDMLSLFKISLPTPIMCGVRTNKKQFSSCILIDVDDTKESIGASNLALYDYTANRAGIGLNVGRIRGIGSKIRGGEVTHTGLIPFLKMFESTSKSCTQNGVRTGATTCSCQYWHYEIEDIIVLKNNAGTDDNRVRKMDYNIVFDKLFFKRLKEGGDITLFNTNEVIDLYNKFGTSEFEEEYIKCENNPNLRKRTIPAIKLAELFVRERIETGRIYCYFIDNEYNQGVWDEPVHQSNLCQEILHKNKPIQHIDDEEGQIGTCILSAINLLETQEDELEDVCDTVVKLLDELIDYQDYPVKAGETFTKNRRSLGIGITNFAAWLAHAKLYYDESDETLNAVDEMCEKIQYYLLKSSNEIAKKKGSCPLFNETKYHQGLMPQDRCNKNVPNSSKMDWTELRKSIKEHGLRHSTLTCVQPTESSSLIHNATNGMEPPKNYLLQKQSKMGTLKQIVPLYETHKDYYVLAFDIPNTVINSVASRIQKWFDMSLSLNHNYDYEKYDEEEIPLSAVLNDVIDAYKKGIKTLYYANTKDKDTEQNCVGGACSV